MPPPIKKIDMARLNSDELKVPPYELPNPLVMQNGLPVTSVSQWQAERRPELLRLFENFVYGKTPHSPAIQVQYETINEKSIFEGLGTQREIILHFSNGDKKTSVSLLLLLPRSGGKKVPVFLGLNFTGNHTVSDDPDITLPLVWKNEREIAAPVPGDPQERGSNESAWQPKLLLESGFGLATAYYKQLTVDVDDRCQSGVYPLFGPIGNNSQVNSATNELLPIDQSSDSEFRPPDHWGKIGVWAWGLSRLLDCLETIPEVDSKKVALMGHSRLGKTALWAGAQDDRFSIVISNNSGCGGAALGRRFFGEFPRFLVEVRPHWFCPNYYRLSENIDLIPVDQHELLALMAPRPLYVASASEDWPADPLGEFLALATAKPVYQLFGFSETTFPEKLPTADILVGETIGYHIRTGRHQVTRFDWEQYITFAKRHWD